MKLKDFAQRLLIIAVCVILSAGTAFGVSNYQINQIEVAGTEDLQQQTEAIVSRYLAAYNKENTYAGEEEEIDIQALAKEVSTLIDRGVVTAAPTLSQADLNELEAKVDKKIAESKLTLSDEQRTIISKSVSAIIESKLNDKVESNGSLNAEIVKNIETNLQALSDRITKNANDIAALKTATPATTTVVEKQTDSSAISDLKDKYSALQNDYNSVKSNISSIQSANGMTEAEKETLKSLQSEVSKINSTISSDVRSLQSEINSINSTLSGLATEIANEEKIQSLEQKAETLEAQIEAKLSDANRVTEEMKSKLAEIERIAREASSASELETLKNANNELKDEISSLQTTIGSLNTQLGTLSTKLDTADAAQNAANQTLQAELNTLKEQKDALDEELESVKSSLNSLTSESNTKNAALQAEIDALMTEQMHKTSTGQYVADDPANTSEGGFAATDVWAAIKPGATSEARTKATNAFGSHVLTRRTLLTTSMSPTLVNRYGSQSGASNNWAWYDCDLMLMTEVEVYGSIVWSSSGYDVGEGRSQFPLFVLELSKINASRYWYWLKAVTHSTSFAYASGYGYASSYSASGAVGVRPAFCIQ